MKPSPKSRSLLALALLALVAECPSQAEEISLSRDARQRITNTVGRSAEAFSILGSNQGASGGVYHSRTDTDSELRLTRFFGHIDFSARELSKSVEATPFVEAGIAWGSAENELGGPLEGDRNEYNSFIASIGGGEKFSFGDHFSLSPGMGFVFANTENSYTAHSKLGRSLERELDDVAVNWDVNSITYVPNLEGAYTRSVGGIDFTLSSQYSYYRTDVLGGGRDTQDLETDSQVLATRIAAEFPLGISLGRLPLRSEVAYARVDLGGDIQDTLQTDYYNIVGLKILTRQTDNLPLLKHIGLEGRYFWGDEFDGWSAGLTLSLDQSKIGRRLRK
ncbi:MAG: hypothetical protein ACI9NC_001866 [Verrucomicrobiales bacterium]